MKIVAALMFFCAAASAAPTLEMVHTAAGSYGVQKAGEDAGPLYAFVRVDSDAADVLTLKDITVERGGKACARMTKLDRIATISEIKNKQGLLRVDAPKGTPFDGKLAKGTTWLRIEAVMDHQCQFQKAEPTVVVHFEKQTVSRALDEHLPS